MFPSSTEALSQAADSLDYPKKGSSERCNLTVPASSWQKHIDFATLRSTMFNKLVFQLLPYLLVIVSGCVSSQMMVVGNKTYPPRPNDYIIEVFCTEEAPINIQQQIGNLKSSKEIPSNAITIGRVDGSGAPAASWGAVIGDAMGKARSLGGDGLVINRWEQTLSGVGNYGETYYRKNLSFSVIRYRP